MSATQRWNIGATHEGGGEVVNPDYLVFGYWQMRSSSGDRSFISFFDGGENWNVGGGVDTITGTAEYRGPAAGRYVTGLQTAPFTASAALTADFGDPSNGGEVTGTISDFTDGRGGMPLGDLEIRLDAVPEEERAVALATAQRCPVRYDLRRLDTWDHECAAGR